MVAFDTPITIYLLMPMSEAENQEAKLRRLQSKNQELAVELHILRQREKKLLRLNDQLYKAVSSVREPAHVGSAAAFTGITFVIAAYNIPRQLRRTLASCSPAYQGVAAEQLEVIVVDNGSEPPVSHADLTDYPWVSQVLRVDDDPSPVRALNLGIKAARFPMIALLIDGAHMLSPGICKLSQSLLAIAARPVINIPQYMLGDVSQSIRHEDEDPYDVEERLLKEADWPNNGYALFDHCTLPGEDILKHAMEAGESNCLITTREVLEDCGGYDERFDEAGAGLANIEFFERLAHDPSNEFVTFPGEGSFHQDHHGTTTALTPEERARRLVQYREKYQQVTGDQFFAMYRHAFYFGQTSYKLGGVSIISTDYAQARRQVLDELSSLYFDRATKGESGPVPTLSIDPTSSAEPSTEQDLPSATHAGGKSKGLFGRFLRLLGR